MAIAKVILNGETLMDVTSNTVNEDNLKSGYTAIKNDGTPVEGAYTVKLQNKFFSSDADAQVIVPDNYIVYKRYKGVSLWSSHTKDTGYSVWCGIVDDNIVVEGQIYNLIGTIQILDETNNVLEEQNFNIESKLNDNNKRINYNSTYIDYITIPSFTNSGFSIGVFSNITASYAIKIDLVCVQNNNNYEGLGAIVFPNTSYHDAYKLRFTSEEFYASKITSFNDFIDSLTYIPSGAFAFCEFDSDITFTNVTSIGHGGFIFFSDFPINVGYQYAFSFPVLTSMGYSCFAGNQTIASINCSILSKINDYAFVECHNLTTAIFPSCTNINTHAFSGCSKLSTLSLSNCLSIGGYAFDGCFSLTSINFPKCTTIGNYAFVRCSSLTTISFPQCTTIGNTAFSSCGALISANFPQCISIGYSAFVSCSSLTDIDFPQCTTINNNAFAYCYSLTNIDFSQCTSIKYSAFAYCYSLTSVNLPLCTTIESTAFARCSALISINLPSCTTIGSSAFSGCSKLPQIILPQCTSLLSYTFSGCFSLSLVFLSNCSSIGGYAFSQCYNLISLYLLGSSVVYIPGTTPFLSTPLYNYSTSAGRWGSIFVRASLYEAYMSAGTWGGALSSRIVSLTDSEIAALSFI